MQPDWSNQIITIYLIGQFKPVKWYDIISLVKRYHITSRVSFLFTALSHWYPHIICNKSKSHREDTETDDNGPARIANTLYTVCSYFLKCNVILVFSLGNVGKFPLASVIHILIRGSAISARFMRLRTRWMTKPPSPEISAWNRKNLVLLFTCSGCPTSPCLYTMLGIYIVGHGVVCNRREHPIHVWELDDLVGK